MKPNAFLRIHAVVTIDLRLRMSNGLLCLTGYYVRTIIVVFWIIVQLIYRALRMSLLQILSLFRRHSRNTRGRIRENGIIPFLRMDPFFAA